MKHGAASKKARVLAGGGWGASVGPRGKRNCRGGSGSTARVPPVQLGWERGVRGLSCPFRPHPSGDGAGLQSWREVWRHAFQLTNLPGRNRLARKGTDCLKSPVFPVSPGSAEGGNRRFWPREWLTPHPQVTCTGTAPLTPAPLRHLPSLPGPFILTLAASRVQSAGRPAVSLGLGLRTPWRARQVGGGLKVATDQLSHCCQQGFQGNSLL